MGVHSSATNSLPLPPAPIATFPRSPLLNTAVTAGLNAWFEPLVTFSSVPSDPVQELSNFLATYNATFSSTIHNTCPYTLKTGRAYPHPTDKIVEEILDAALGCPPTYCLPPIGTTEQGRRRHICCRQSTFLPGAIGREVLCTPMQQPNHKLAKDWLGLSTALAHTAPVIHYILDKARNKEFRVHINIIKAHLPPIGRTEFRPMGAFAASAFGSWLFFNSPLADDPEEAHLAELVALFRPSVPAVRFLYGCSTAFNK
ncbi:hypothetical protein SARC_09739 [Sphaeroforma arctica JP610]|uniref:Uncharacterized protein n=1 Tax=Sphaeroforma arctica JP610 TaxID=667725 RepID=A0A0L0FM25_9EUKA|nr:hypothetical protein SARC_09739 [Sphaeroforma arctica JP610]KNC77810.1 hypothetical protein SARC_09739 [Sphaeroforma arctica JP610]|eukprot:XP_014151712.1 hypothetical protein SARC_09739 [Sphaeroforma arctica JP610]